MTDKKPFEGVKESQSEDLSRLEAENKYLLHLNEKCKKIENAYIDLTGRTRRVFDQHKEVVRENEQLRNDLQRERDHKQVATAGCIMLAIALAISIFGKF